MEKRYKPLTESRRAAVKALKKSSGKLEPEEDSDDDMYSSEGKIKEGGIYDVKL